MSGRAASERLAGVVGGLIACELADAYARPAAEDWSTAEILAHLVTMLPSWAEQAPLAVRSQGSGRLAGRTMTRASAQHGTLHLQPSFPEFRR